MTVTKITNERKGVRTYHVTYNKKSRCGNPIERTFRDCKLPWTVTEVLLFGTCIETKYGKDGTKVEVFRG